VQVLEETSGEKMVARYVEADADHYAHAENYCMMATMNTSLRKK